MAREVTIWGQRAGVPRDYVGVRPGDANVTRYIKKHSDTIYIRKQSDRRGYTRIVGYYARADVVRDALRDARENSRRSSIRAAERERSRLLVAGATESAAIFLALDSSDRRRVFEAYAGAFGERKAEYTRRAFAGWQAGDSAMSREMRERLLRFVPPLLSFDGKYRIVKALWEGCRPRGVMSLHVGSVTQIPAAVESVVRRLGEIRRESIPKAVTDAVAWLSEEDSQLALLLYRRFGQEEDRLVAEALDAQLTMLHEFVRRSGGGGRAIHEVSVPGLLITVRF